MWYLLKRSLQMVAILAILSAALFGLLTAMPGNPVDLLIMSNPSVKPEDVARLKVLRGLNKPWYVQYVRWLWGYPEPVRPPKILPIEASDAGHEVTVDLAPYLIDPNFVPKPDVLGRLVDDVWPDWRLSPNHADLRAAIDKSDLSFVLMEVAKKSSDLQKRLMTEIERLSVNTLSLTGLFGSEIKGTTLTARSGLSTIWFKATNPYGQESVGNITVKGSHAQIIPIMKPIANQFVEQEGKPFTLDLRKFFTVPDAHVSFELVADSPGKISKGGDYENHFLSAGQSTIQVLATNLDSGVKEHFAFCIEHGVVGHENKVNRGFLFALVGDRGALGFSQTYKRPVYDLLFGAPTICGDGNIDPGETCDDFNHIDGDGCSANCMNETESTMTKAEAKLSGFIVRSGRIGNTVQLMLPAIILSLLMAIPLGVFSACRQYSLLDYVVNFLAFLGISLPVFWFGIMMIYIFAEVLQIFPAGGVQTPGIYADGVWAVVFDRLKHAVLPTLVLSIFYVGQWLRYMRSSMLEVLPKDYIRTARAKGLSEWAVILKHAFRNALIPVVTILALSIPSLFGGAVLTETVFSWPGIGRLQYDAVMGSDYYVAIVVFLVSAMLVMVGNLLADAIYVLVDPRIRKK